MQNLCSISAFCVHLSGKHRNVGLDPVNIMQLLHHIVSLPYNYSIFLSSLSQPYYFKSSFLPTFKLLLKILAINCKNLIDIFSFPQGSLIKLSFRVDTIWYVQQDPAYNRFFGLSNKTGNLYSKETVNISQVRIDWS